MEGQTAAGSLGSGASRPLEDTIVKDFRSALSYGDYLHLDEILGAQHPMSQPEHHDELLFIIQHQTSELWLKLMLHELVSARDALRADELPVALKRLARVKRIQDALTGQWSVLATLTPSEYVEFRDFLATSSGFQSYQYRAVEFILGNKNADLVKVFAHDPVVGQMLTQLLHAPSLYDEFLRYLSRAGHPRAGGRPRSRRLAALCCQRRPGADVQDHLCRPEPPLARVRGVRGAGGP